MLFLACLLSVLVDADVYMHNPHGCNDRNCERNVNRNNGNLLFDSQNNAKGGYACPRAVAGSGDENAVTAKMEFEANSMLEVEWTSQHGCGKQKEPAIITPPLQDTSTATADALKQGLAETRNVHCEIVLEMMCARTSNPDQQYKNTFNQNGINNLVAIPREGIPNSANDAATNRAQTTDPGQANVNSQGTARIGMHETPQFYNDCNRVQRNRGLFTADQNVNRRSAIGTRQNPNGGRRGLECPEERDYYPYWRPSPFMGVAYLVDNKERCGTQAEAALPCGGTNTQCTGPVLQGDWVGNSQGFVGAGGPVGGVAHGACVTTATGKVPKTNAGLSNTRGTGVRSARDLFNRREWPNNQADCNVLKANNNAVEWKAIMFTPGFVAGNNPKLVAAAQKGPECNVIDYSRSNHLGNSGGADTATRFTMTVPDVVEAAGPATQGNAKLPGEPCLLRLRYNMSSSDYKRDLNSTMNGNKSPIQQDPLVKVGAAATDYVQLALNTNQVARTFQDRSYVFYITPSVAARASSFEQVMNVNVRGKRGNIVQTYPAVEYDFIPNRVVAQVCDTPSANCPTTVLDLQWTGSDYNPRRGCNDGEGGPYTGDRNVLKDLKQNNNVQGSNQNSRTDRMSMIEVEDSIKNYPNAKWQGNTGGLKVGAAEFFTTAETAMKFATANAKAQLAKIGRQCLTKDQIDNINNENRRENNPRNCAEANALSPYFESVQVKAQGGWITKPAKTFFSARNNNFSNRDSKLVVMTMKGAAANVAPASPGGIFTLGDFQVTVNESVGDYNPETGSYSSEDAINEAAESDIPGFDPVENDDYGEGAKAGCTQDLMYFDAAYSRNYSLLITMASFLVYLQLL